MSKIRQEVVFQDFQLNKYLREYHPKVMPPRWHSTICPVLNTKNYLESFAQNSYDDKIAFSAMFVNRLLKMKKPKLVRAGQSVNQTIESDIHRKLSIVGENNDDPRFSGINKEAFLKMLAHSLQKQSGQQWLVNQIEHLGIEARSMQVKATQITHSTKQVYYEFVSQERQLFPPTQVAGQWIDWWFKRTRSRMGLNCVRWLAQAAGYVDCTRPFAQQISCSVARTGEIDWLKEYMRNQQFSQGFSDSNEFQLLFKADVFFSKGVEQLANSHLNPHCNGKSLVQAEKQGFQAVIEKYKPKLKKKMAQVEQLLRQKQGLNYQGKEIALSLLNFSKDREQKLRRVELVVCKSDKEVRLVSSGDRDAMFRQFLKQKIMSRPAYEWLTLILCHDHQRLEHRVENKAKMLASSESHLKYFVRFLKLQILSAKESINKLISYVNYFRELQRICNNELLPPERQFYQGPETISSPYTYVVFLQKNGHQDYRHNSTVRKHLCQWTTGANPKPLRCPILAENKQLFGEVMQLRDAAGRMLVTTGALADFFILFQQLAHRLALIESKQSAEVLYRLGQLLTQQCKFQLAKVKYLLELQSLLTIDQSKSSRQFLCQLIMKEVTHCLRIPIHQVISTRLNQFQQSGQEAQVSEDPHKKQMNCICLQRVSTMQKQIYEYKLRILKLILRGKKQVFSSKVLQELEKAKARAVEQVQDAVLTEWCFYRDFELELQNLQFMGHSFCFKYYGQFQSLLGEYLLGGVGSLKQLVYNLQRHYPDEEVRQRLNFFSLATYAKIKNRTQKQLFKGLALLQKINNHQVFKLLYQHSFYNIVDQLKSFQTLDRSALPAQRQVLEAVLLARHLLQYILLLNKRAQANGLQPLDFQAKLQDIEQQANKEERITNCKLYFITSLHNLLHHVTLNAQLFTFKEVQLVTIRDLAADGISPDRAQTPDLSFTYQIWNQWRRIDEGNVREEQRRKPKRWHITEKTYPEKTLLFAKPQSSKFLFVKHYKNDLAYLHTKQLFKTRQYRLLISHISKVSFLCQAPVANRSLPVFYFGAYQKLSKNIVTHTLATKYCASLRRYLDQMGQIRRDLQHLRQSLSSFVLEEESLIFLQVVQERVLLQLICAIMQYYHSLPEVSVQEASIFTLFLNQLAFPGLISTALQFPTQNYQFLSIQNKTLYCHFNRKMRDIGRMFLDRQRPRQPDLDRLMSQFIVSGMVWPLSKIIDQNRLQFKSLLTGRNMFREKNQLAYQRAIVSLLRQRVRRHVLKQALYVAVSGQTAYGPRCFTVAKKETPDQFMQQCIELVQEYQRNGSTQHVKNLWWALPVLPPSRQGQTIQWQAKRVAIVALSLQRALLFDSRKEANQPLLLSVMDSLVKKAKDFRKDMLEDFAPISLSNSQQALMIDPQTLQVQVRRYIKEVLFQRLLFNKNIERLGHSEQQISKQICRIRKVKQSCLETMLTLDKEVALKVDIKCSLRTMSLYLEYQQRKKSLALKRLELTVKSNRQEAKQKASIQKKLLQEKDEQEQRLERDRIEITTMRAKLKEEFQKSQKRAFSWLIHFWKVVLKEDPQKAQFYSSKSRKSKIEGEVPGPANDYKSLRQGERVVRLLRMLKVFNLLRRSTLQTRIQKNQQTLDRQGELNSLIGEIKSLEDRLLKMSVQSRARKKMIAITDNENGEQRRKVRELWIELMAESFRQKKKLLLKDSPD